MYNDKDTQLLAEGYTQLSGNYKKLKFLKLLAQALNDITEGEFGEPTVRVEGENNTPVLSWDGPSEWALAITNGENIYWNEIGDELSAYNSENVLQLPLQQIIDQAKSLGIFLEPINTYTLGAYNA